MLDDLQKAMKEVSRNTVMNPFDAVENIDGVAVFKRNGNVVGWMNWQDFETLMAEMKQ